MQANVIAHEWCRQSVVLTDTELLIGGKQVMQAWERPLMEVLAREVTVNGGDILEVGFGMGISAQEIVNRGCHRYTVIEAHPEIAANARRWGERQRIRVTVVEGFWQDVIGAVQAEFDGILFDTFPVCQEEAHTNPAAMIPAMQRLLRRAGILTYYSGAFDSLPQDQLRLLLAHFDEVKLIKVSGLQPYPHPRCDYWNQPCMIVPVSTKPK